jgi:hypothetical protein
MWLGLGVITLLLSIGAALLVRAELRWIGSRHDYRGADGAARSYELQCRYERRRPKGYRLGIRAGAGFDATIRGENEFDRFAKRLCIARGACACTAGASGSKPRMLPACPTMTRAGPRPSSCRPCVQPWRASAASRRRPATRSWRAPRSCSRPAPDSRSRRSSR